RFPRRPRRLDLRSFCLDDGTATSSSAPGSTVQCFGRSYPSPETGAATAYAADNCAENSGSVRETDERDIRTGRPGRGGIAGGPRRCGYLPLLMALVQLTGDMAIL